MHFYVSYGDFSELTLLDIIRVLLAYDGAIERQIDKNVDYVITKRLWNPDFEKVTFWMLEMIVDLPLARLFKPIQRSNLFRSIGYKTVTIKMLLLSINLI